VEPFDTQKLIAEVAARHGILLKANDAAFALVTMNQIVLAETLKTAENDIKLRVEALEKSIQKVERLAGKILAQEVKTSTAAARREINGDVDEAKLKFRALMAEVAAVSTAKMPAKWLALGVVASIVVFVCGFFVGQVVKFP
jgi:hypothetical protein